MSELQSTYELAYQTPGITKIHTDFLLPEIKLIKEICGEVGIYFIQDRDGYIKIGQTTKAFKRISMYKTHRAGIRLVGFIVTGKDLLGYNENILHRLFEEFIVTGEWFAPARPLIKYISLFCDGFGSPIELYHHEPITYQELIDWETR